MTPRITGRRAVLGALLVSTLALAPTRIAGADPDRDDEDRTLSPYFFVPAGDDATGALPLKRTWAEVDIAGVIADVTVHQEYANEGDATLEAIYVFPGSTRAAVHGMTMTVGERVIEAEIQERQEARETYEQALDEGRTASLLEQQRPNVFQISVGNILPGDEVTVELRYTELLVPTDGLYEFVYPTVVGPRYGAETAAEAGPDEAWIENPYLHEGEAALHTFGLDLSLYSGIPIAKMFSPSHFVDVDYFGAQEAAVRVPEDVEAGNRDFVLRYALAEDRIESGLMLFPGEDESFFLLMVEPPRRVEVEDVVPREYIYILDVSGSMHGFPLETSKELMRQNLESLRSIDTFNILFFAGGSALYSPESLPATEENVDKALRTFEQMRGGGGTELLPALTTALDLPRPDDGRSRIVVVATDGYVAVEEEAFEIVRRRLGEANLFPFGIGSGVNRFLIEGLAHAGMGEPFVALDGVEAAAVADRFAEYVSSPVLQGIDVEFDGFDAYLVEPPAVPDLFASRPIVVFGKYDGEPTGRVTIRGMAADGPVSTEIDVADAVIDEDLEALRYLWARHRIRRLDDLEAIGTDPDRVAEVTELGLDYNLLTRHTSFVAVDRVVRADGAPEQTVRQPLPLPEGVSDHAVGVKMAKSQSAGIVGSLQGYGAGGSGYGSGGLGARGSGMGGGSTAEGLGGLGTRGRGRAAPSVSSPMIMGSLDRTQIDSVIKQRLPMIRHCYQKCLQADPGLAGKVVVEFTIAADGTVEKAEISSSTVNDETLEQAILEVIEKLVFPAPPGGGSVVVSYPFVFSAS